MSETKTISDNVTPSATPTEDDVSRWQALPRDEQVKRLRQTLSEAAASGISGKAMDDIEAAAKERLVKMRHG
ncbi:MAG: hypothetical protein OEU92_16700 [Alphaproteobacteria bacterium]|nr:hypothetical protein [Alphaproteobacteria bacterium]